jgi:hypothetical protein
MAEATQLMYTRSTESEKRMQYEDTLPVTYFLRGTSYSFQNLSKEHTSI